MIVLKFGGTSVQDASAIRRASKIMADRLDGRPLVVVSAMAGVTNGLVEVASRAAGGGLDEAGQGLDQLIRRHIDAARELAPAGELHDLLEAIDAHRAEAAEQLALLRRASAGRRSQPTDLLLAQGELLSSRIVAAAFRAAGIEAVFVDVRPLMRTNGDHGRAVVDMPGAAPALRAGFEPLLERGLVPVTQGFIGSSPEGRTTTIGRGGSDLSASIIGAALDAREIQIWTDVDGLMTTDPRVVPGAALIETISFAEASELATFGARVLHPSTLRPAMLRDIPVRVLNSRRPEGKGTTIIHHTPARSGPVTAIAFKRGITVLNVTSDRMLMAHGFLARLFDVFSRRETSVDMVATSEVSVSMTLDDVRGLEEIAADLKEFGDVAVDRNQAIVCLVGDGLKSRPGIVARIFSALGGIPVSMISHGASAINLSFVVPGDRVEEAVAALHAAFFEGSATMMHPAPGRGGD